MAQDDAATGAPLLVEVQRLPTSGARAAYVFEQDGVVKLAVPQLAVDVADRPAHMNGGDSDTDLLLFAWNGSGFAETGRLPVPGGEDAITFAIDGALFLATASVRAGHDPYDLNVASRIFRWEDEKWAPFQEVPTFAGKQWHFFEVGGRRFLALAQGVTIPSAVARHPRQSAIFEWDGKRFEPFQTLDGGWGYNFASFVIGGEHFLAYADHTSPSLLYRWDGSRFEPVQVLAEHGGRAFCFFEQDGERWLAVAAIDGDSVVMRWDGERFVEPRRLGGPGGREFALVRTADALHLARVCFIEGSPQDPKTDLVSQIYRWRDGGFDEVDRFATFGGTDASVFEAGGERYLVVSNSLTAAVRFRQDMVVYRLLI
ncbi:hypothetical protein [Sphingomonas bacterium]|uniref:hypothetical protein n=1 Tax=Sphingomonas bacterium TaxID=1895847 RepID=UPI0015773F6A|nr:hypothetical protein [Sphingomonas bacterium]